MQDAADAIDNMHNSELYGRVLRTNYAQPMKIKGGDKGFSHQAVRALLGSAFVLIVAQHTSVTGDFPAMFCMKWDAGKQWVEVGLCCHLGRGPVPRDRSHSWNMRPCKLISRSCGRAPGVGGCWCKQSQTAVSCSISV